MRVLYARFVAGGRRDAADVEAALAVLEAELDAIEATPGSSAKTETIRILASRIHGLNDRVNAIRKADMLRIKDEEKLSLAKLADRVGMSKARADQIMNAERIADAERRRRERETDA